MKQFLLGIILGCFITAIISLFVFDNKLINPVSPAKKNKINYSLKKYEINNLKKINWRPQKIIIDEVIKKSDKYTSYLYHSYVDTKSLGFIKNYKVSGMLNIPNQSGNYPVIVMFRGFAPVENYITGTGTRHGGEYLAASGFITIAPDFLGYGKSEYPPADVFEARFLTYVTANTLIKSLSNINQGFAGYGILDIKADTSKIGIWAHSNGGQIALTALETLDIDYPTTLWAPVTKSFPYNILYFTDDIDDEGKALRKELANFEKYYDAKKYSITCCLADIQAPLQLHQGIADSDVPLRWSNDFYKKMLKLDKKINYFTYSGDDHNFAQGSWQTVIDRDIEFYRKYFKN